MLYKELDKMKVIPNKFIPFKGYLMMNFFGILFLRKSKLWYEDNKHKESFLIVLNHERIHNLQAKKCFLGWIGFYIAYLWFFFVNLFRYWNWDKAYHKIPFEREAYINENNFFYTESEWRKYKV